MELSTLPEHVVVETTEHKCLQSQFSVLYNEAMQLKTQLEEARNQLQVIIFKNNFSVFVNFIFNFIFKDYSFFLQHLNAFRMHTVFLTFLLLSISFLTSVLDYIFL